ncbi:hypothetical protein [Methylococcus sp. Mc7]|jgi:hypothetical protein|uniref:hypothetical protein n=1 Tax=Methylococcus sp. Mc7 TaxID=2860258 RepID=UPI001C52F1B4|nr:hypothetical protein [Methylococcus sp. Mc7]QXP84721.1 hypothetical protein KW115_02950 [Methylococcus sp. Mc7]
MTDQPSPTIDPKTQATLDCLRRAVEKALERKRRLGQYAIVWSDNGPMAVGEDAPPHLKACGDDQDCPTA